MAKVKSKKVTVPKFFRDVIALKDGGREGVTIPLVASSKSPICLKCGLNQMGAKNPYMEPQGSDEPLITVVMDSIAIREDEANEMALQADGYKGATTSGFIKKIFTKYAEKMGMDPSRIRFSPLTRCASRGKVKPNYKVKGNWCRYHLLEDLRDYRPSLIVPVGTTVLGALCHKSNAQEWGGKLLTYRGWPDDWLTDPKFINGHPVYGQRPDWRIPMIPLQAPGIINATQNQKVKDRWLLGFKKAVKLIVDGVKPLEYLRPWYRITEDVQLIKQELKWLANNPGTIVTYDTETTGLKQFATGQSIVFMMFRWDRDGEPVSIGFPWKYDTSPLISNLPELTPYVLNALYASKIRGHNLTFDILFTYGTLEGADLNRLAEAMDTDTWHALFTLKQAKGSLGLDLVAYDWCPGLAGYEEEMTLLIELYGDLMNPANGKGGHYANCPRDLWKTHLEPYVMGDVEVAHITAQKVLDKLNETSQYKIPLASRATRGRFRWYTPPNRAWVYENIVRPASRTLCKITGRGIHVNQQELSEQEELFPKQIKEAKNKLKNISEKITQWCAQMEATVPEWEFDLENKGQLKELMFKVLELPIKRLTKGGQKLFGDTAEDFQKLDFETLYEYAACDKFTLNSLAVDHPNVRPLQDYRKTYKLYTGFVRPLRNYFNEDVDKKHRKADPHLMIDGHVHSSFLLTGTRSGRLCVAKDTRLEIRIGSVESKSVTVEIHNLIFLNNQLVFIKTHKGRWRQIKRLYFKGYEEMLCIRTEEGAEIKATAGHRLLTPTGWKHVGDLSRGDVVNVDLCCGNRDVNGRGELQAFSRERGMGIQRSCEAGKQKGCSSKLEILQEKIRGYFKTEPSPEACCSKNRESKRVSSSVNTASEGGAENFAGERLPCSRNRSEVQRLGIYSSKEFGALCASSSEREFAFVEGYREQPLHERAKRFISNTFKCFQQFLAGSGNVFYRDAQSLSETKSDGLVFEELVPKSDQLPQGSLRRSGGDKLELQQSRNDTGIRAISAQHSILERVHVQREHESRFCSDRDEHSYRSGWLCSQRSEGESQRCEEGTGSAKIRSACDSYNERSGGNLRSDCNREDKGGNTDTVASISLCGVEEVWDIEVEEDHSYVAQGFVNHNSSRDPNLQQLPKDGIVKRIYTSRYGDKGAIYQADLSQIELRLLAAACGDESMVKAYNEGLDLHSLTQSYLPSPYTGKRRPYEECLGSYADWCAQNGREKEAKQLGLERRIAKCVNHSTLVSVNGQIRRIGTLSNCRNNDTFVPLSGKIQTGDRANDLKHFYYNGVEDQLLVVTRNGILACSKVHRFALQDGSLVEAQNLKAGDVLKPIVPLKSETSIQHVRFNPFMNGTEGNSCPCYVEITPELAYFIGLFVGDGCSNENSVTICAGRQYEDWQKVILDCTLSLGFNSHINKGKDTPDNKNAVSIYLGSRHAQSFLRSLGLVNKDSSKKLLCVPEEIFNSPDSVKLSFMAGLIDTDGSVSEDGLVSFLSQSWKLTRDYIVLAQSLGMYCFAEACYNKTYKKYYYRARLALRSSFRLKEYSRCSWKKERIRDTVITIKNAEKNVVKNIIPLPPEELMDVEVDTDDHLYITDGFTTHNCVNFLTGYGGGAYGLMNVLAASGIYLTLEQCENIIENFFEQYPGLKDHIGVYKDFICQHGVAVSLFGRVRILEEVHGDNQQEASKAQRAGYNHLIQSTASDMMLTCLNTIEAMMRSEELKSMLVLTVHDSLVIDAHRSELDKVHEIVTTVMENIPTVLDVWFNGTYDTSWANILPFGGDYSVGLNYLDDKKVKKDGTIDWDKVLSTSS